MKQRKRIYVSILGAVIILSLVTYELNPLHWLAAVIHWWLLNNVPRGSDISKLEEKAKIKG